MAGSGWGDIGERLREARMVRGLGQQQLSDALHLDRTAVAKLESGQRRMTALELLDAAEALRVPLGWLVAGPAPYDPSAQPTQPGSETVFDLQLALHEAGEQAGLLAADGHLTPRPHEALHLATEEQALGAAADVRARFAPADRPLGPMADVAAALGLHVTVIDSTPEGATAPLASAGLGVAVLGGGCPAEDRRFACARLVGRHLAAPAAEPRLDTFATALLLPPDARTARTRPAMIGLVGCYGVPWSVAVAACGSPDVGEAPTRGEFVLAGVEPPDDLRVGHRSLAWRQAVLRARAARDLTDAAALAMLGEPSLTPEDLPPLPEPAW